MTKTVRWTIDLPMEFDDDWDDDLIEFHLNESSWCASNIIQLLDEYDQNVGCLCNIAEAKVLK